jgi:hypothetical protein
MNQAASILYSIMSQDNDGDCLFLSSFPQPFTANVRAAYIHLPSLLIVYVQSSDST